MNQSEKLIQKVLPELSVEHGNSNTSDNPDIGTFLEVLESELLQRTSGVAEISAQSHIVTPHTSNDNVPNQEEWDDALQSDDDQIQDIAGHEDHSRNSLSESSQRLIETEDGCRGNDINDSESQKHRSNQNPAPDAESGQARSKISVVSIQKLIDKNSSIDVDSGASSRPSAPIFIPVCKSEPEVDNVNNQLYHDQLNTEYKEEPSEEVDDYVECQMKLEESFEANNDISSFNASQDLSNATIRYATGKSISYFDDKIPAGWKRVKTQRKNGQFERFDVYYFYTTPCGQNMRFRSRVEIQQYLDAIGETFITCSDFEFQTRTPSLPTVELQMTDLREREAAKKLFAVEKRKGEALQIDDNFLINCVVITSEGQNVYHDHKVPTGWSKTIEKKTSNCTPTVSFVRDRDKLAFYSRQDLQMYFESIEESTLTPENFDFSPIVNLPPPVSTTFPQSQNKDTLLHQILATSPAASSNVQQKIASVWNPKIQLDMGTSLNTSLHLKSQTTNISGPVDLLQFQNVTQNSSALLKNTWFPKHENDVSSKNYLTGNQTILNEILGMPRTTNSNHQIGNILQSSSHQSQQMQQSLQPKSVAHMERSENTLLKQMLASTSMSSTTVPKSTFATVSITSSPQNQQMFETQQQPQPVKNVAIETILKCLLASTTLSSPMVPHNTLTVEKKTIDLDTGTHLKTSMHLHNPTLTIRNDLSCNIATRMQPNIHRDVTKVVYSDTIFTRSSEPTPTSWNERQSHRSIDRNGSLTKVVYADPVIPHCDAQNATSSETMQIASVTGSYNPWFDDASSNDVQRQTAAAVQDCHGKVRNSVGVIERNAPNCDVINLDEEDDDIVVLDPRPVSRSLQLQQHALKQIPIQEFLSNNSNFSPNLSNFFPGNVILKYFGGSTYTIYDERIPVGWQKWIQGSNSFFLASFVSPRGQLIPSQPEMQKYLETFPEYSKFRAELLDFDAKSLSKSSKILSIKKSESEMGYNVGTEHNGGLKRRKIEGSLTNQGSIAQGLDVQSRANWLSNNGKENSQLQSTSRNAPQGSHPEVIDLDDDDVITSSQNPPNDVTLKQLLMREIDSEIEIETKYNLY